ncbi:hypothetical protein RF11_06538 [Thelohanellus kitauei]|uniref:Alpha-soluble NSF attachment protein n=1 Tax=Thelohanellus kitauei TaxID=669202 RepID=A0A0C2N6V7_THEKT|nr:hypothetical protein RF11_06538 [Thelohanellus kitauei]
MDADSDLIEKRKQLLGIYCLLIKTAQKCEDDGKWEEAGNAHLEAAKFAEDELVNQGSASAHYLAAANSYHRVLSERAYDTYNKAIETSLKDGSEESAISISVMCGYQYEKDRGDFLISDEFYDKADDLRVKYNLEHACSLTNEYMQGLIRDVTEALQMNPDNAFEIINEKSKILRKRGIIKSFTTDECRKCVHFSKIFDEYVNETRKVENQYEMFIQYRNKIDWLKEHHDKFEEKLNQTMAYIERLVEERKNAATNKDPTNLTEDA